MAAAVGEVWQPEKVRTVFIDMAVGPGTVVVTFPSNATGPSLTLEFEKVFSRVPTGPVEHDIELEAPLLLQ